MNFDETSLRQKARDHLIAAGLDPDADTERPSFSLAEHMTTVAMSLFEAHIPPIFAEAAPDHLAVIAWVDAFLTDPGAAPDLFLRGPTGSGKSWQAYGAIRHIALTMAQRTRRFQWRVTTFAEFNAAMRPRQDEGHLRDLDSFQKAGLLLLDDLGAGLSSNWSEDNLYRLIDYRWSHKLPSIVTTNMTGEQITTKLDERVVSRLRDSVQVAFSGPDRRMRAA